MSPNDPRGSISASQGIHIADAFTFLDPGSDLDEEALERGTTILPA